jgi:hypothetical protein
MWESMKRTPFLFSGPVMVQKSLNPAQNAVKQKYNTAPDNKGKDD